MFNPLIFQGIYYLAKMNNSHHNHNDVPDCCSECKHFRGMKRKCKQGRYPSDKDDYCIDEEDYEEWDDNELDDDFNDDFLDSVE